MLEQLELSRQAAEEGDASRALEELDPALERWLKADSYTHIFIRHSEIDSTADAFYELREVLLAEELEGCDAGLREAALPYNKHTGDGAPQAGQYTLRALICPAGAWDSSSMIGVYILEAAVDRGKSAHRPPRLSP